jgi:hypothetical protein
LRGIVRIRRCLSPLSRIAWRTPVILLLSVDSHDATAPYGADQVILAHNPVALRDQILQDVENLGLDRHEAAASPQFASVGIERVIVEDIDDFVSLRDATLARTGKKQGFLRGISKRKAPPALTLVVRTR